MAVIVVSRSVQLLGIRRGEVIKMSAELAQLDEAMNALPNLGLSCASGLTVLLAVFPVFSYISTQISLVSLACVFTASCTQ